MKFRDARAARLWSLLDSAFLKLDPLGVADEPETRTEYHELVSLACGRLYRGVSPRDVAEEIARVMDTSWGVPSSEAWVQGLERVFIVAVSEAE
jgi:hypothetical protein